MEELLARLEQALAPLELDAAQALVEFVERVAQNSATAKLDAERATEALAAKAFIRT